MSYTYLHEIIIGLLAYSVIYPFALHFIYDKIKNRVVYDMFIFGQLLTLNMILYIELQDISFVAIPYAVMLIYILLRLKALGHVKLKYLHTLFVEILLYTIIILVGKLILYNSIIIG